MWVQGTQCSIIVYKAVACILLRWCSAGMLWKHFETFQSAHQWWKQSCLWLITTCLGLKNRCVCACVWEGCIFIYVSCFGMSCWSNDEWWVLLRCCFWSRTSNLPWSVMNRCFIWPYYSKLMFNLIYFHRYLKKSYSFQHNWTMIMVSSWSQANLVLILSWSSPSPEICDGAPKNL